MGFGDVMDVKLIVATCHGKEYLVGTMGYLIRAIEDTWLKIKTAQEVHCMTLDILPTRLRNMLYG